MKNLITSIPISLSKTLKTNIKTHHKLQVLFFHELIKLFKKHSKNKNFPIKHELEKITNLFKTNNPNVPISIFEDLTKELYHDIIQLGKNYDPNIFTIENEKNNDFHVNYNVFSCNNDGKNTTLIIDRLGKITFNQVNFGITIVTIHFRDNKFYLEHEFFGNKNQKLVLTKAKKAKLTDIEKQYLDNLYLQELELWNDIIWYIRMYRNTRHEFPLEKRVKGEVHELLSSMHKRNKLNLVNIEIGFLFVNSIFKKLNNLPEGLTKTETWDRLRKYKQDNFKVLVQNYPTLANGIYQKKGNSYFLGF